MRWSWLAVTSPFTNRGNEAPLAGHSSQAPLLPLRKVSLVAGILAGPKQLALLLEPNNHGSPRGARRRQLLAHFVLCENLD